MTWKTGDTVALPIYFEGATTSLPASYASMASFVAAGGAFTFYQGGSAVAVPPVPTLTALGLTGWHWLTFVLPAGVDSIIVTKPANVYASSEAWLLITPNADEDSIAATLAGTVGTPVAGSSFSAYDFTTVEGDIGIVQEITIPAAALVVFDATLGKYTFTDLSDIGGQPWTVAASARGAWNELPASATSFDYSAVISDKINRKVCIGFDTAAPAGAVVKNPDGTADTLGTVPQTTYLYDIQLKPPTGSTYAARKITVALGSHTIRRQQTTTP